MQGCIQPWNTGAKHLLNGNGDALNTLFWWRKSCKLQIQQKNTNYAQMSFICHIHNYTEYNEELNVFSAFNPSIWSSGQPTLQRPGSSWGFSALLKSLTSVVDSEQKCSNSFECADEVRHIHLYILYILAVVDTSCQSRDSNPQPWGYKSNSLSIRPRLPMGLGILSYLIESWAFPVIFLLIYPSVWLEISSFVSASVQFHDISFHNVDNHVFQTCYACQYPP